MTSEPTNPPLAILGVPFDNITTAGAIARIEEMIASRRPHYLVTANVDFLVQALEDEELRRILVEAHLVLCDGTPLLWASRLLGNPLPERVAGADLVPLLIRVAAQKQYRLFFLGATPESCTRAVANLRAAHPSLLIAGHYSPPFNPLLEMDHQEITRRINEAKPDLLFVSLGCPKQEKWIAMHYRALGVPVAIGVGATIDFLAGQVKRAPLWVQRVGLEWVFRLIQEPRRLFRRYVKDLWAFGWSFLLQWWQLRLRRVRSQTSVADLRRLEERDIPGMAQGFWPLARRERGAYPPGSGPSEQQLVAPKLPGEGGSQRPKEPASPGIDISSKRLSRGAARMRQSGGQSERQSGREAATFAASGVGVRDSTSTLRLPDHLDLAAVRQHELSAEAVPTDAHHCLIEMANVTFIDSTGVGLLIRWQKQLHAAGRQLVLVAPGRAVRRALSLMRLERFFAIAPDHAAARQLIEARLRERTAGVTPAGIASAGLAAANPKTAAANGDARHDAAPSLRRIAWHGEITAANAEEIWRGTHEHLCSTKPPPGSTGTAGEWDIDLSDVRFIDSTGLGLMVRAKNLAEREGARLAFTGPQPAVRNVLRLARLEERLGVTGGRTGRHRENGN